MNCYQNIHVTEAEAHRSYISAGNTEIFINSLKREWVEAMKFVPATKLHRVVKAKADHEKEQKDPVILSDWAVK